jgi:hypothetical protein
MGCAETHGGAREGQRQGRWVSNVLGEGSQDEGGGNMQSVTITCDRCGAEQTKEIQIEVYEIRFFRSGYAGRCERYELCAKCRGVVEKVLSSVADSIVPAKSNATDGT